METSLRNSFGAEVEPKSQAPIPWDGIRALGAYWAGAGSLYDWLPPEDWQIERNWTAATVRARTAYVLLARFERMVFPFLPADASDWMDVLEQQLYRVNEIRDYPTAHTDWAATAASFGRYPSSSYVERRPLGTWDTPATRTLRWFGEAVGRAEDLIWRSLGQHPLSGRSHETISTALSLPEVASAAETADLNDFDVTSCTDLGGVWEVVAENARRLAALWSGSLRGQLIELGPILPDIGDKLFELAVLGTAAAAVRVAAPVANWTSHTPIASAQPGLPCLLAETEDETWSWYFQTVPDVYRTPGRPYNTLARYLGQGILRPDLWVIHETPAGCTELLVEAKYSLNRGYVADGIPQVLAYFAEYPPEADVTRIEMVVCPDGVVDQPQSWERKLAVGSPTHLKDLVNGMLLNDAAAVLDGWA